MTMAEKMTALAKKCNGDEFRTEKDPDPVRALVHYLYMHDVYIRRTDLVQEPLAKEEGGESNVTSWLIPNEGLRVRIRTKAREGGHWSFAFEKLPEKVPQLVARWKPEALVTIDGKKCALAAQTVSGEPALYALPYDQAVLLAAGSVQAKKETDWEMYKIAAMTFEKSSKSLMEKKE